MGRAVHKGAAWENLKGGPSPSHDRLTRDAYLSGECGKTARGSVRKVLADRGNAEGPHTVCGRIPQSAQKKREKIDTALRNPKNEERLTQMEQTQKKTRTR